jgi:hypothetical protein
MTEPTIQSKHWVYDRLICEFDHHDICLKGLVESYGEKMFCRIVDQDSSDAQYTIHRITWTPECDDYMADYRVAYVHWFHVDVDGQRPRCTYDGWPLAWFSDKWKGRNPIEEAAY